MSAMSDPAADLLERLGDRYKPAALQQVRTAVELARAAHTGQRRGTGEPYLHHSLAVAAIVDSWHLDLATIVAAVLHDVPEDTDVSVEDIQKQFGDEIAVLVEAVTKLSMVRVPKSEVDYEVENLRRLFLAMSGDLRVVLLKLADRLHNMRTMKGVPPNKRRRIARETLEIYAPLADRLGMGEVRSELDDLGFRYAEPKEYIWTKRQVEASHDKRTRYVTRVRHQFEQVMADEGITATVNARTKNFYSLYRKLLQKARDINQVYDLFAIRIIVDTIEQCYQGMGIIHRHWQPLPHRIKDYIAVPKANGYRSLHTTIFGPGKRLLEVQLRTKEMHEEAELGVAAHAVYSEKKMATSATQEQLAVMKQLASWQGELAESADVIGRFKLDMFGNRIFVFTPKGSLHSLPNGATPVDFAYYVHSEIGNTCAGSKVNGAMAPLDTPLHNGDVVEILTRKGGVPKRDWLSFVRTGHARSHIRAHFRKLAKADNVAAGQDLLEAEIRKDPESRGTLTAEQRAALVKRFPDANDFEAVLQYLGEGRLSLQAVRLALGLDVPPKSTKRSAKIQPLKVGLSGMSSLLTKRSKCCNPRPFTPIIGYVTAGKGISIHRQSCSQVTLLPDRLRIIEVNWED